MIHTVGPIYSGKDEDDELLRSCYRNSLNLAMENDLRTIAFPSISTGVYGYPVGEAAFSACDEMYKWFEEHPDYDIQVTMVCFDQETYERYGTAASMLNVYRHADKYLAMQKENGKPKTAPKKTSKPSAAPKSRAEGMKLYIKRETYKATGSVKGKNFVVYKGSGINPQVTGVLPPAIEKLRKELIENGGVDADYILTEDVICTSSSAAAALVVGHTLSGPMNWRNRNGKTLKDIE